MAKRKGGTVLSPISAIEIESWARLLDLDLKPYEADLLMRLDETRLSVTRKGARVQQVSMTDSAGLNALLPGRKAPKPKKATIAVVKPEA